MLWRYRHTAELPTTRCCHPTRQPAPEPAKRRNSIISDFVFSVGEFKSLRPAASRAQRSATRRHSGEQVAPCSASAELFVCSDVPVLYNVSSRQRNIHLTKLRELRAALIYCPVFPAGNQADCRCEHAEHRQHPVHFLHHNDRITITIAIFSSV